MAKFSENEPIPSIEPQPKLLKEIIPPKETPKVMGKDTDDEIYEDDFDEPVSSDDEVPVF
eukprot:CAMPEP_0168313136 /NCGR_PEP_ID=MMETSP0210-20121227/63_1 /TAXON_ID=40633 /ORGANISM="Condylostoma magnum, Strain COL2" /LENGTH=59 /DNA_ID=CAMNT_0008266239 /DNA_START=104 /DNA_END=283 /DNA_ORIENTATION=+